MFQILHVLYLKMELVIFWLFGGFLRFIGVFFFSLMGAIFCFYKCAIKQIFCQRTMENENREVKSYPLIRAAIWCVGGRSMSFPQCKERMESSGKFQSPMKLQNLWLHPEFPHSTFWINLWPCLCRTAAHCHAWLCLQPAKSHWSRGLFLLSSLDDTRLLREVTLGPRRSSLIQLSSCLWFSAVLSFERKEKLNDAECHIHSRG